MRRNRVRAFTLIDVLTAIFVSSIVITASFYFLGFVDESQNDFQDSSEEKYTTERLYETINDWFLTSDDIVKNGSRVDFFRGDERLSLMVESDYLLMDLGKVDSLKWSLESFSCETLPKTSAVTSLFLTFELRDIPFEWYFYKNFGKAKTVSFGR